MKLQHRGQVRNNEASLKTYFLATYFALTSLYMGLGIFSDNQ